MLGGGLLPGKLTVVLGASGIGKTQLGIQFAHRGRLEEGQTGLIFDMTARGDSQNHADYARRLCHWELQEGSANGAVDLDRAWDSLAGRCDYLRVFDRAGRRVTARDLSEDDWHSWKKEQVRKLDRVIEFFYSNFAAGVRRCVIDGIEPTDTASNSIQFETFEYIYQQILHKDYDWLARDLFRAKFLANRSAVDRHAYDHRNIGCLMLCTSHEVLLDQLIDRPIQSGDVLSNANTIILMGKTRQGNQVGRALQIAKHRGSVCDESVRPFQIASTGIELLPIV
jgi:KaiC/GvpD/RAD55 family RecA-like ATPase